MEVDQDKLKLQVALYKRLKNDGYMESADKEYASIIHTLGKVQESDPAKYDELVAYIGL